MRIVRVPTPAAGGASRRRRASGSSRGRQRPAKARRESAGGARAVAVVLVVDAVKRRSDTDGGSGVDGRFVSVAHGMTLKYSAEEVQVQPPGTRGGRYKRCNGSAGPEQQQRLPSTARAAAPAVAIP
jgi:hypothetical protein